MAVAYLLQFVQSALPDTALLEVILGRIHYLLDDLLVDVALSFGISYRSLTCLTRPSGGS